MKKDLDKEGKIVMRKIINCDKKKAKKKVYLPPTNIEVSQVTKILLQFSTADEADLEYIERKDNRDDTVSDSGNKRRR